ncbi:MAG TPA: hypothetical protein LFW21_05775 [Rickettsia endosymbiont of Pyrocoelia pectoralis]|nr:hypothetical protein [Rickettsia endosymbiont of Pyrocoelia pectoralis]
MSIFNFSHFKNLNPEQEAELKKILTKLHGFTKSLKVNVVDLETNLLDILRSSLKELSKTENINVEKIEELFNNTLKKSLDTLSEALDKTYQEQLKNKDIFLFDGIIVEKCLNVLEQILKFQQGLDKIHPGASKKIIKSLENMLVGIIATQTPVLGAFIQASGLLEKVNNLIDHEKLLPKVTKLRNDIKQMRQEIKASKELGSVAERAEQVAGISEISNEPIKKVIEVEKNPNNKASLETVMEAAKEIPKNKAEIEQKISKLKDDIEKTLPEKAKELPAVKDSIKSNLENVKKELLKAASPETSFSEKITSIHKAAEQAMQIANDVQKIAGVDSKIGSLIGAVVQSKLLPAPILAVTKLAPDVANLVKIGKAVASLLSKTQNLNKSQERAKG